VTGSQIYVSVAERLLSQPGAIEDRPFGPEPFVAKVGGKMFALLSEGHDHPTISLKVDPEEGELLRTTWDAIGPGYHLNKRHWVTITLDGSLPDDLLTELIQDSYALVVKGLPRAARESLAENG
jgi:predicted DNA-binding protein (MmcQ/YjbR family)